MLGGSAHDTQLATRSVSLARELITMTTAMTMVVKERDRMPVCETGKGLGWGWEKGDIGGGKTTLLKDDVYSMTETPV